MAEDPQDLVPVFETAEPALLPLVKSLLDSAEIPYVVQGEEAMSLLPVGELLGPFTKRGLAAIILVRPDDAEAAKELLAQLNE